MARHVPRVYCALPLADGQTLRLPAEPSHHLLHVLRLAPGDPVILFDGSGGEYPGEISGSGRDWLEVRCGARRAVACESPLRLTLAQGMARGERMDYVVQKAVELGVTAIQPLDCERCGLRLDAERLARRHRHWQAVAQSAAEQCGRDRVPEVAAPLPLARWLDGLAESGARLLLDPEGGGQAGQLPVQTSATLLVGPEGGLSPAELRLAAAGGFTGLRLGPRVLRTETAGVAALTALQLLWGDLGR